MKVSYNWLRNYLDTDVSVNEIENILTSIGLEVESVELTEEVPGGLAGVVVGEVIECSKHPDADKLSVTKVSTGKGELLSIVCGAPNVSKGQKVFVATVGTTLTFSNGESLKIKRAKIRGEESQGMICAEDELGIGESHDGIMVLPEDTVVGTSAKEALNLRSDYLFEIGLTPNRVDASSHFGVARELHAYLRFHGFNSKLKKPETDHRAIELSGKSIRPVEVSLEAPDAAPKYCGLTLSGIKVAPSPAWLQKSLKAIGVRPINNVVDITNFVLHETGQPLHAFDYNKITGEKVVVRMAKEGEKFITLDGIERKLSAQDLMICDSVKPMCIAGVFGGEESGVTTETTAIFLESAYFNPVSVRKSSKRHSLKTDASFRFERGADPDMAEFALYRASQLLCEYAGASVTGDIVNEYPKEIEKAVISLDFNRIESLIGKKIGKDSILSILQFLDFEVVEQNNNGAVVKAPLFRVDVTRECDVTEEILRIYGYNNVELPVRMSASLSPGKKPDPESVRDIAAGLLVNNGFYETMNNSLTKSDYYVNLTSFPHDNLVMLLNPLSSDLNSMRQTLIFNALEVIAYNINRQNPDLKLFEFGNVYHKSSSDICSLDSYSETSMLSMFITGPGYPYWRGEKPKVSFFMLKGYIEALFKRFGVDLYDLVTDTAPEELFAEGIAFYTKGGKKLAVAGTLKNSLLKKFDIKQAVYGAEISWDLLLNLAKKNKVKYRELPKYPEVKRDLALVIDESVNYSDIRNSAFAAERKLLKDVTLFDVYRGDKIPEGKKQYAISFTLQDLEKTLTDKSVEDVMSKLLSRFKADFGAALR